MHHNKDPPGGTRSEKDEPLLLSEWSGSQKSSAHGSSNTLCASSNQTPCFARLALFLRSSQSKRSISRYYLDMLTLARGQPLDVVGQVLSALEAGRDKVITDEMTRQVKAGLSNEPGIYLDFDPRRAEAAAR